MARGLVLSLALLLVGSAVPQAVALPTTPCPTSSSIVGRSDNVLGRVFVTPRTVRLEGITRIVRSVAAEKIYALGDWFEVSGVNTATRPTEVVYDKPVRYRTGEVLIRPAVGRNAPIPSHFEAPVTLRVGISEPQPTAGIGLRHEQINKAFTLWSRSRRHIEQSPAVTMDRRV